MGSKVTVDPGKLTRFSAKILQKVGVEILNQFYWELIRW